MENELKNPGQDSIDLLNSAREECFGKSGSLDIPLETRNQFSARRKEIAEIIDNLLLKNFHEFTADVKKIDQLRATNKELSERTRELDNLGKSADNAARSLGIINQIIQIGSKLAILAA